MKREVVKSVIVASIVGLLAIVGNILFTSAKYTVTRPDKEYRQYIKDSIQSAFIKALADTNTKNAAWIHYIKNKQTNLEYVVNSHYNKICTMFGLMSNDLKIITKYIPILKKETTQNYKLDTLKYEYR